MARRTANPLGTNDQRKAALAALDPAILAERQRAVDVAVREARNTGHCNEFNRMLNLVYPEMCVEIGGYNFAFNTDGVSCTGDTLSYLLEAYGGTPQIRAAVYDGDGYNVRTGYDRDGFDRSGYDESGYSAEGFSRAYSREYRRTPGYHGDERWYATGFGEYSKLDADGKPRVARPATVEEAAAEAEAKAAFDAAYFNPTTWKPATEVDDASK